jgi:chromosome segregation ATPase
MSGKIATTEAAQLWEESRAIREWSAKRMEACDAECTSLRAALSEALGRINSLEEQLENAHEHILDLEREKHE